MIHGDKYDYSLVIYKNFETKVSIGCKIHDVFQQTPHHHLKGQGCQLCSYNTPLTTESFIIKAEKVHKNRYDYLLVEYKKWNIKVSIICKEHGIFKQIPNSHLNGQGCPKCIKNTKRTIEEFIEEALKTHGELYDYSNSIYKNANTKLEIICDIHGPFFQRPSNHLRGEGCLGCKQSKGERKIENFLKFKNIKFDREKRFKDCKDIITLPFDFYLPQHNLCIEYDGMQHFKSIPFFGGDYSLCETKKRDEIKNEFCKKNNIYLLRIPYYEANLEQLIENLINNIPCQELTTLHTE